jgi:Tol biopolymer transport system component
MKRSWYQRTISRYIPWLVSGFLLAGSIIDIVNNTANLITPPITIWGTVGLVTTFIMINLYLKRRPLLWTLDDGQQIQVRRLGEWPMIMGIGIILALWLPRLFQINTDLPATHPSAVSENQNPQPTPIGGGSGRIIYYNEYTPDGPCDIFSINSDGSNPHSLTDKPVIDSDCMVGNVGFSISPDAKEIAYNSWQGNTSAGDRQSGLYVMNSEGGNRRQITFGDFFSDNGIDHVGSWSYDGSKLAFLRNSPGVNQVYFVDNNSHLPTLFAGEAIPVWSPTEERVFVVYDNHLLVMRPDGTDVRDLAVINSTGFTAPTWSPDGRRIAYTSNGNESTGDDIYIVNVDDSRIERITHGMPKFWNGFLTSDLVWSPKGDMLAFDFPGSGSRVIYTINDDGSNMRPLTTHGEAYFPAWSPDGSIISYILQSPEGEEDTRALYTIHTDGTQNVLLASSIANAPPAWLPSADTLQLTSLGVESTKTMLPMIPTSLAVYSPVATNIPPSKESKEEVTDLAFISGDANSLVVKLQYSGLDPQKRYFILASTNLTNALWDHYRTSEALDGYQYPIQPPSGESTIRLEANPIYCQEGSFSTHEVIVEIIESPLNLPANQIVLTRTFPLEHTWCR